MSSNRIPPVIKWSGSKRPIANQIAKFIPSDAKNFFDPFVGGGSLLPYFSKNKVIAGDVIEELISLWRLIKNDPELVIAEYKNRWLRLQKDGYSVYYTIRKEFNRTRNPLDFLFLSRTCVNGLIRYNKNGDFNNSFHNTRPGIDPDRFAKIILLWSDFLKNTEFFNQDYRKTLISAKNKDFIFLDPPYVGTHGRYMPEVFDFELFFKELERLNGIGAYWILTMDGQAGERRYEKNVPKDLYKEVIQLSTGKSPFSKVMSKRQDVILESIYFNFKPVGENLNFIDKNTF